MYMQTANEHEYYWSLDTTRDLAAFTFRASNFHGNARVYEGSPNFVTDQLSRNLGLKLPPLTLCQQTSSKHHTEIRYDDEVPQLSQRLLKVHLLIWNLEGTILRSPQASTWWLPYNKEAMMRYGHTVNSSIPENPDEAEFLDEPWPQEVTIRIKSHPGPQPTTAPVSADGSSPMAMGPPATWMGTAPGLAPPISQAASGLQNYSSPNDKIRTVEGQEDEPPEENLQQLRGVAKKDDLIHSIISWATLESYPLRIGVSLPVVNPVMVDGEEVLHEAQLWEETEEQWIVTENHAAFVYGWLAQRFASRSSTRMLPMGMLESVDRMAVQTMRDGGYGYILFAP
jgi:hypothetical protein